MNIEIEVNLVQGRLPNKLELKAVANDALKSRPNAYMKWVFFYLPKMKSGSGAYATDHRIPKSVGLNIPEGVDILDFMLFNTSYEHLLK